MKRATDFVARYGGEEFAIILPETDLEPAILIAETIGKNVESLQISHVAFQVAEWVTLSLGRMAIDFRYVFGQMSG